MNITVVKRLEALEAARRQTSAGPAIDRYIAYVAHIDEMTDAEVAALREAALNPAPDRAPLTPQEIARANQRWDDMLAWEMTRSDAGGST